jgi:casein kinase II subunit alpha
MWDLLQGLDHIHSKGVMHRDIKPSNIMITSEDKVKIIDFDLAEFLAPSPHELNYTLAYKVATPGYKAPESMLKQKMYDYRFDTYSAGCIFAAILFRKAPFFPVLDNDEQWHSTMLVRGVAALKKIDYRKKMKKDYRERWKYVQPWDLFEDFKV